MQVFGVVFVTLSAMASAGGVSPITKVVALMEDLKKQLEEDGVKEAKLYNEYNHWCDSETMATKNTIADLKEKIADLTAFLQEEQAKRDQLDDEIAEAGASLAAKEAELKAAQEVRDKEHSDFKEAFQVFEDSIDELTRSLEVLAKKLPASNLVQVASVARKAIQRNPDLGLSDMDQQALSSFFAQEDSGMSRNNNVLAPDAPLGFLQTSETGPSSAVVEALQKIKADQETNRDKSLTEEQTAKNNFEQLKASLEDSIKGLETEMATKKSQRAESEEASAKSQAQLDQAEKSLAENEKYLEEITSQCEQKAREWKERTKLRSDEITAVSEAVQIMTSEAANRMNKIDPRQQSAASFVQTGMKTTMKRNVDVGQAIRNILQGSGSPVLSLLASRVQARMNAGTGMGQPDPFADVRKMIQDMVEKLMAEAAEEAQHKEFCDKEMGKSTKQKTLKEKEIKKISGRIEEMEAAVAELTDELEQLSQSMAEMEAMTAEATELRQKEKAEALLAIKQYQDAQSLIGSAMTVLQEFYSKQKSLVQTSADTDDDAAPPPETWDEDLDKKEGHASGIIGLLEIAQSDFARLESETSTTEAVAEREYQNLMNENEVKKAVAAKDVEYKSSEKTKLEGNIQRAKSDLEGFQKELDAVNDYLEKLKPECTAQVDSFEERKARREQEIESLKEALAILEGNAIP